MFENLILSIYIIDSPLHRKKHLLNMKKIQKQRMLHKKF